MIKKIDISSELQRVYTYPDGTTNVQSNSVILYITEDGGHRILSDSGWVHYIPKGWTGLKWLPKDPNLAVIA